MAAPETSDPLVPHPLAMPHTPSPVQQSLAFALVVSSTVVGIAGIDLVLPAVPSLPEALGGSIEEAQLVLAGYSFGTAAGLLVFGELGSRFNRRLLLGLSLLLFALTSFAASWAGGMTELIVIRVVQGAFGAAAAVFAPGLIRALYGDDRAVGAMGRLGSIESLTPALAPLVGVYLLDLGGWRLSFDIIGALALLLALIMAVFGSRLPKSPRQEKGSGGYLALLRDLVFLRYALSQAFSLGSLLIFVFGMPAVLTGSLQLGLSGFVTLQIVGVSAFIVGASSSASAVRRFGAESVILGGTLALTAAFVAMLLYAFAGGSALAVIIALFVVVNFGFGLRGPAGFHRAVVASGADDARGSALVVLGILGTAAGGTALAAPFIALGLAPLVGVAALVALMASASLLLLPALREDLS
ncbi:MFS transporter [Agaricicola taiwanensis]|uniref:MFS transporter n=2 Tax=Agaricicola taiwanensis TaxID=591372 RepID=A0A8J2VNZ4_9RHOB|nr:MFS transporter [Agaricicola taiwanensis]